MDTNDPNSGSTADPTISLTSALGAGPTAPTTKDATVVNATSATGTSATSEPTDGSWNQFATAPPPRNQPVVATIDWSRNVTAAQPSSFTAPGGESSCPACISPSSVPHANPQPLTGRDSATVRMINPLVGNRGKAPGVLPINPLIFAGPASGQAGLQFWVRSLFGKTRSLGDPVAQGGWPGLLPTQAGEKEYELGAIVEQPCPSTVTYRVTNMVSYEDLLLKAWTYPQRTNIIRSDPRLRGGPDSEEYRNAIIQGVYATLKANPPDLEELRALLIPEIDRHRNTLLGLGELSYDNFWAVVMGRGGLGWGWGVNCTPPCVQTAEFTEVVPVSWMQWVTELHADIVSDEHGPRIEFKITVSFLVTYVYRVKVRCR